MGGENEGYVHDSFQVLTSQAGQTSVLFGKLGNIW